MSSNSKKVTVASSLTVVAGSIMMVTGISSPYIFVLGLMLAVGGVTAFLLYVTSGIATWADDLVSGNRVDIEWEEPLDGWDENGKRR